MKKTSSRDRIKYLTYAGITAALYIALTGVSAIFGLASGTVQVRLSEALCTLPVFFPAAVPGVTVGCLLSNMIFGGTVFDVVLGTFATLVGAILARLCRRLPYLAPLPTIVANTAVIPFVLILSGVGGMEMYPFFALTVGAGEIVSCGVFGVALIFAVRKNNRISEIVSK